MESVSPVIPMYRLGGLRPDEEQSKRFCVNPSSSSFDVEAAEQGGRRPGARALPRRNSLSRSPAGELAGGEVRGSAAAAAARRESLGARPGELHALGEAAQPLAGDGPGGQARLPNIGRQGGHARSKV